MLTSSQQQVVKVSLPKGSSTTLAWSLAECLKVPVVMSWVGNNPEEFQLEYIPSIEGNLQRTLGRFGRKFGLVPVGSQGDYSLGLTAFPSPYPIQSFGQGRLALPRSEPGRFKVERDVIKLLNEDGKSEASTGAVIRVKDLGSLLKGYQVHWFLDDFYLTVAFKEMKVSKFVALVAQATCGSVENTRGGLIQVNVDKNRMRSMWLAKLNAEAMKYSDVRSDVARLKSMICESLTDSELDQMLKKPKSFAFRRVDPTSQLFKVGHQISLEYVKGEFLSKNDRDQFLSVVAPMVEAVNWRLPAEMTILPTDSIAIGFRNKSDNRYLDLIH